MIIFKKITEVHIPKIYMSILSCVFSYILLSMTEFIFITTKCPVEIKNNLYIHSFMGILIGVVLSIIFSIIYYSKIFGKFLKFISHKTQYESIWRDVINFKTGSNFKVYIKNENYYVYGSFKCIEVNREDPYISVNRYGKYDKITNELLEYEDFYFEDEKCEHIYVIKMSNVDHIEIE
ncbi:MAG: hypothetical protein U0O41_06345 [Clostridia bacterium]